MRTDHTYRTIREFQPADEADVVAVWHRAGIAAYTFLPTWQAFTLEQARGVFARIDRLYVDPREWRKGWGTQLVNFAKQVSPRGLELHTHQENFVARVFYERHGFRAVKFGFSPPPESAPDVEYHWRPG